MLLEWFNIAARLFYVEGRFPGKKKAPHYEGLKNLLC